MPFLSNTNSLIYSIRTLQPTKVLIIGICNIHDRCAELSFFDYMLYHNDNVIQAYVLLYLTHLHQKLLEFDILFQQAFNQ